MEESVPISISSLPFHFTPPFPPALGCVVSFPIARYQTATDALSRYDQIIVTARIVLMFDGSSGQSQAIREAVPLFQQVYKIIRSKCPQWHEGNVQLMGVYLAITFLEYGLNSQTLGVDGQR